MPGEVAAVFFGLKSMVLPIWYWSHCAAPALDYFHVTDRGRLIALALTGGMIAAALLNVVAVLMDVESEIWPAVRVFAGIGWIFGVAFLIFPEYSIIVQRYKGR